MGAVAGFEYIELSDARGKIVLNVNQWKQEGGFRTIV